MFDLGDELTLENYKIPWLFWIQLIVFFLILLILFCFALFPLDPANDHCAAALDTASTSTNGFQLLFHDIQQIDNDKPLAKHYSTATTVVTASRRRHTQGRENLSIKDEITRSASLRREEITEGEAPSPPCFHPCHYIQLARVAFLKCLGLDSAADTPSTRRCRKRKES